MDRQPNTNHGAGDDSYAQALAAYHRALIAELSKPRYAIDERFVRLLLLLDQGRDAQGIRFVEDTRKTYTNLRDVLAEVDDPALVLLGAPGSGKTTLLRRLQLDEARLRLVGAAPPAHPLTYFVSLNRYPLSASDPRAWLAQEWNTTCPGLPPFETLAAAGGLLVLLDALNEMRHTSRDDLAARIDQWRDFLRPFTAPGNRVVFTCRSLDYSLPLSSAEVTVRQVNVKPMTPAQIHEFLDRYLPGQSGPVWQALQRDPRLLDLFSTPYFLKLLCEQVSAGPAEASIPTGRAALFTGFIRRTLAREIDARNRLLIDDGLLDERDRRQIATRSWSTPQQLPERGCLIPKLSALACHMQRSGLRGQAAQVRLPEPEARAALDHPRARDILTAGAQINALDEDVARDDVLFFHQLLQEFFAARHLARAPDPALAIVEWRADRARPSLAEVIAGLADHEPLPPLPTTGWEETILLAAAMSDDVDAFVRHLAGANLPLAGRCAAAPDVADRLSPALKAQLQQRLIARTEDPGADLRARIAAGQALGTLGDPRFEMRHGPHGDYLLPPLVTIPGGVYPIGDDASPYEDERPAHTVELAAFQTGRFPVTNAEYALFMRAGGYDDARWWDTQAAQAWRRGEGQVEGQRQSWRESRSMWQRMSEEQIRALVAQNSLTSQQVDALITLCAWSDDTFEAWLAKAVPAGERYRQPRFWDDPDFNNPAQPVVGITWYEARAYCAWLSAQTGRSFRLPSEAEWEAAARGQAGRAYAYGAVFDPACCNTFESHIRRTTPVGIFPGGETPEGVADLCGNVWDWTSSAYLDYPYVWSPEREDPNHAAPDRALRGGSWNLNQVLARAVCRFRLSPYFSDLNYVGFRVVAAPVQNL